MRLGPIDITPDAAVSGLALAFHPAVNDAPQTIPILIAANNYRVRVSVQGSNGPVFSWPETQCDLGPGETAPPIPVTFNGNGGGSARATLWIRVVDPTPHRWFAPIEFDVPMVGNEPLRTNAADEPIYGAGPGALRIVHRVRGFGEVIHFVNASPRLVDVGGCVVGDFRFPRETVLRPGARNTGFLNDTGDTVWIRNENDQVIASQTFVMWRALAPVRADRLSAMPPSSPASASPLCGGSAGSTS